MNHLWLMELLVCSAVEELSFDSVDETSL